MRSKCPKLAMFGMDFLAQINVSHALTYLVLPRHQFTGIWPYRACAIRLIFQINTASRHGVEFPSRRGPSDALDLCLWGSFGIISGI